MTNSLNKDTETHVKWVTQIVDLSWVPSIGRTEGRRKETTWGSEEVEGGCGVTVTRRSSFVSTPGGIPGRGPKQE